MILRRAVVLSMLFFFAPSAHAADVWGTIVWKSGAPAAGIELRLVKRGNPEPARIVTNNAGRYGLYGLSEPTTEYSVQVMSRGAVVKTQNLPPLKNGNQVPNIVIP